MFEAFQPADALEAVQAANAVAAGLAAMDSFTRAARPGLSDQTVTRLRSSALAAGRVFDVAVRARGGEQPPARTRPQSSRAAASRTPAVPPPRPATAPNCRCPSPALPMRRCRHRDGRSGAARPLSPRCSRRSFRRIETLPVSWNRRRGRAFPVPTSDLEPGGSPRREIAGGSPHVTNGKPASSVQ